MGTHTHTIRVVCIEGMSHQSENQVNEYRIGMRLQLETVMVRFANIYAIINFIYY